jgi:hypothetical protein
MGQGPGLALIVYCFNVKLRLFPDLQNIEALINLRLLSFHILSNVLLDIIYITEVQQSDEAVDICDTSNVEILKFVKCLMQLENLVSSKMFFNVYVSMHRNNILIYMQQDAKLHSLFYLETAPQACGFCENDNETSESEI